MDYKLKIALIFLTIIFFFKASNCLAQDKLEISTGLGLMEFLNIGVNYNFSEKLQSSLKIGTIPFIGEESLITLTGAFSYFYTGCSEYTKQPTWYLSTGLNYLRDETQESITQLLFLNIRHGKVFNFNPNLGLKLEVGLGLSIFSKETMKVTDYWSEFDNTTGDKYFMPNVGIDLFYRF